MKFEAVEAPPLAVALFNDRTRALLASVTSFHEHCVAKRGVRQVGCGHEQAFGVSADGRGTLEVPGLW